jgi:uncharacterized protein with NRDE domain
MCLILAAWRVHPRYPLVVAANRDEFFARPTAPVSFWPHTDIVAGRDLQAGGTWMGVSRGGRFAALTNYRDPTRHRGDAASRGQLVADFLAGSGSVADYLDELTRTAGRYNDFNLLVGDDHNLACFSSVTGRGVVLEPGIHGLSNHLLDSPWPKVVAAKSALAAALDALPDERPFFELLRDDSVHPDGALPRTGVSLEWERLLSSAFVRAGNYGTRSSTLLLMAADGVVRLDEQTWLPEGKPGGRVRFRFSRKADGSS